MQQIKIIGLVYLLLGVIVILRQKGSVGENLVVIFIDFLTFSFDIRQKKLYAEVQAADPQMDILISANPAEHFAKQSLQLFTLNHADDE